MLGKTLAIAVITGLATALLPSGPDDRAIPAAGAADFAEERKTEKRLRFWPKETCEMPRVLEAIEKRFNQAQRFTYHTELLLESIENPREYAARDDHYIFFDRTYCRGTAIMNNGRHYHLFYELSDDRTPPLGNGIEWCIVGLDRMYAHKPGCRLVKPL
ncbi:MAG: hypothetical protein AAF638_02405 [Pseudomonadota bacterium]